MGGQRRPRCEKHPRAKRGRHVEFPHPASAGRDRSWVRDHQARTEGIGPTTLRRHRRHCTFLLRRPRIHRRHRRISLRQRLPVRRRWSVAGGTDVASQLVESKEQSHHPRQLPRRHCGNKPLNQNIAEISDGVTILTASTAAQYAMETPGGGSGVFTSLFVDALSGAAANLVGSITPGSIYAHIDQSLGPWAQRPVFKTNVKTFISLREATAPIELAELQQLTNIFPDPTTVFELDPSYEPHRSGVEDASVSTRIRPTPLSLRYCKTMSRSTS